MSGTEANGLQSTVIVLAAGSFMLGVLAAAAVLVLRAVGLRRDLRRIEQGLGELVSGNAAFRIRSITTSDASRIAEAVNRLAESRQDEHEEYARQRDAHTRLVTNMSHDLRTPITSIAGYADALRRGIGDDPDRYLDVLADKAHQLARLTDDLFYMSRIESGDLALSIAPLDLCEIARQQLLGFEPQLSAAGATVEFLLPPDTCRVSGDESAVRRVIDNIVSNALRHAKGMTKLSLAFDRSADSFELTVADDGQGLTEDAEWLFDRGASGGGGTGLGLSIARELALSMRMTLEAGPGEPSGTVFTLRGPVAPAEPLR